MNIHETSTSASLSQADPQQEKPDTHGGTPQSATYLTSRGDLRLSWFQRRQYWASRQWFYEITACVLTALSLVGIATLLAVYDRRPTPEWPRIITINSAISILTTILKGSMMFTVSSGLSQLKWTWFLEPRRLDTLSMFDEASRGPWGATIFLFGRVKR
ncbi:hypothetical protein BDZ85DRAFT_198661 [Elsinoe ampelina]|uniref:Uncharacterized protein n=1 Tax=Elsinoe ampelina TaxID=302913 RepID=A0A6A6GAY9_9PEZI|nr:hypothetical protein BDZ85DRAFT_198661 [Elsinoe ampelina]